jgi:hypothetical protein
MMVVVDQAGRAYHSGNQQADANIEPIIHGREKTAIQNKSSQHPHRDGVHAHLQVAVEDKSKAGSQEGAQCEQYKLCWITKVSGNIPGPELKDLRDEIRQYPVLLRF